MQMWLPWILCGAGLLLLLAVLKIYFLHRDMADICRGVEECLSQDSNMLLRISGSDRRVKRLAVTLNNQLRQLHGDRRRFQHGDLELKEAVANISHDLRTPLTAICGYLDLLEPEMVSPEGIRYVEQIKNRTEAMKQLTEELFRYSVMYSVQEWKKEPLDLRKILEESLLAFGTAMEQKGIEPEIELPERRMEKILDEVAVERIFNNIISNALKYSDGDFSVKMDESGTIIFSNQAKHLTPVLVERLFDRFYTVETGRKSTGLGLSIAKLLTEGMGGSLTAKYAEEKLYLILVFPEAVKEPACSECAAL